MDAPRFVFAGGGTGGHLFPGLAVAEALRRRLPDAEITFFTTMRELDEKLLAPTPFQKQPQVVRPFSGRPWRWPGFWRAWRASVRAARDFLRQTRPRAVLGLGGYAAGPPVVAARKLGIRTAILNPDAVPGRANRFLARYADLVVVQWDVAARYFRPQTCWQALGCPIRGGFATADAAAGRRLFGLNPHRPTLLVTGASQGAQTINAVMQWAGPTFVNRHPEWQILHLTGPADEAVTRDVYQVGGVSGCVLSFTHEMPLAIAAADAVLSRAGASTLAELTAAGRPSILLPYPYHRDRHQHANAQVLVDAGAAVVVEDVRDPEANLKPVLAALEHLADATTRAPMSAAARQLGRPDAADAVAAWLLG